MLLSRIYEGWDIFMCNFFLDVRVWFFLGFYVGFKDMFLIGVKCYLVMEVEFVWEVVVLEALFLGLKLFFGA